jgi:replicative DNA helicase
VAPSASILEPADFYAPKHRLIYAALRRLIDHGDAADLVTLSRTLGARLEDAGGAGYLSSLMDGLPRLSNVAHWARIVKEHATRRRIVLLASKMREHAETGEEDAAATIERGIGALIQLARSADPDGFLDNRELAKAALREIEDQAAAPGGIIGLRTGLIDLDRKLQGMRAGQLGLVGARLKYGKSILAIQIADCVAKQCRESRVAIFSREMSGKQLMKRRLSAEARVSLTTLHRADPETLAKRYERLAKAFEWCSQPNVQINTTASNVPAMRSAARQLQAEHGLAMIVVDYVQLVESAEHHQRRDQEIKAISGDLKRLALDLEVPVLAVVQLSRGAEQDGRPAMHHIAEGDGLARDCDWAVLIDRAPKPKKGEAPLPKDVAHLIVAANRDGQAGTVPVRFNPFIVRFENLAREEQEQAAAS